jgi:outer membrane protein OmpA-like peptidoglycan-associated protein
MDTQISKIASRVLAVAFAAMMPVALCAQVTTTTNAKTYSGDNPSKWDIFVGYSYLAPKGTIDTPYGNPPTSTLPVSYVSVNGGGIVSIAYYFNKHVGLEGVGDFHLQNEDPGPGGKWKGPANNLSGGAGGVILRFPAQDITAFVHGLVGGEVVGGPFWQTNKWGPMVTAGGGLDLQTPWFNHRLAIRLFEADYQYIHEDYGQGDGEGRANINAARLSAGVVFHIGQVGGAPVPVTLACSATPQLVFPGDPVTVTATSGGVDPKLSAIYSWSGSGVTGSGTTASVATASLAPGTYTVQGSLKVGKPGKEGLKPGQSATCSASFTVKAFEPPTISCSANPSTIKPGDTSSVSATGMSPQNRPLTYSYTASAGSISGSGSSATYSSAGAPTGVVGITCNVSDDKGQTATANTSVTIEAPAPPPQPHTQALCSISFDKDAMRPTRVDNEAKACLDQVALDLQQQPDAKVVVVGESTSAERTPKKHQKVAKGAEFAAQRAVNTKEYLVTDKGIDATRISVATGSTDGDTVENYLVPSGATFTADVNGTNPVDESMVKPQVRKPLGAAPEHHHKKAAESTASPK